MSESAAARSQVYVSYAWGDDLTPEGRAREAAVRDLCEAAEARGVVVRRDKTTLHTGDRISEFMKRIGAGDRIFVFLSDKYLRSPFCMFELFEIWRNSRQEDKTFLDRIRFYPLPDAKYREWKDWIYWVNFWKQQHDELDEAVKAHGARAGSAVFERLRRTQTFYTQVSDILALLADSVSPRDFDDFIRHGFEELSPRRASPIASAIASPVTVPAATPIARPAPAVAPAPARVLHIPRMVTVPPGRFFMGSPSTEEGHNEREEPRHVVRVGALEIGAHPVTVDAFAEFISETGHDMGDSAFGLGDDGWKLREGWGWLNPGFAQAGDHPVTCVNWHDAMAFIEWLNDRIGDGQGVGAFRLPSEAEWEYACRAGTDTPFSFGETLSTDRANYDGNFVYGGGKKSGVYLKRTTPVGRFPANALGLYDMHGNVWEWCQDTWHENYKGAPPDGSPWVNGDNSRRVLRGGSWINLPVYCRSACRIRNNASNRVSNAGFRLARTLSPFSF